MLSDFQPPRDPGVACSRMVGPRCFHLHQTLSKNLCRLKAPHARAQTDRRSSNSRATLRLCVFALNSDPISTQRRKVARDAKWPNVPDQRLGAPDLRFSTRASSPGSLHLACWRFLILDQTAPIAQMTPKSIRAKHATHVTAEIGRSKKCLPRQTVQFGTPLSC